MKRIDAQLAAYRLRHYNDADLESRLAGFRDGYGSAEVDLAVKQPRTAAAREAVPALVARVRGLEAQRDAVLAEVEALEQSDWLRDTVAGGRLRAVLTTGGTPSNTERNES